MDTIFSHSIDQGFPNLLVHWYSLDTLTDLYVPPKFCDVSLKKSLQLVLVLDFTSSGPKSR